MRWPWRRKKREKSAPEEPREMRCPSCDGPTVKKTVEYTVTVTGAGSGDIDHFFRCSPCEFIFTPAGKPYLFSVPKPRSNPFAEDVEI